MYEIDYLVFWRQRGVDIFNASVVRLSYNLAPKGARLTELASEAVAGHNSLPVDSVDAYFVSELPKCQWCVGVQRELSIDGRAATLEANANGWAIHI